MNAAWHRRHAMPKPATVAQRVAWHRAHQVHCACRPIPASLAAHFEGAAARIPDTVPEAWVPHYRRLNAGLAAAGQPSAEGLARLKDLGFATVVNLRPTEEAPILAEEPAIVAAQGLRYVAVPVTPSTFCAADVAFVGAVLEEVAAAPVLLHCASANRVGALWGAFRHRRGLPLEEAEAEARRAGLSSEAMREAFHRVAAERSSSPG